MYFRFMALRSAWCSGSRRAGLIHVIARTLGGRGDFAGLAKLVGYAALVGLVALPVALVDALLKLQGAAGAEASFSQLAGLVGRRGLPLAETRCS